VINFGNLKVSCPCVLSPLSGISDLSYRLINRSFGCELAFVEMISARALVYQSKKTLTMLRTIPSDRPLGIQLLGDDPLILRKALAVLEDYNFDVIDFNAACPVGKVTRRGEGASLLKEPFKLNSLLRVLVKNATVPITAKIRAGWDGTRPSALDVALHAQDAGIKALFIHGRTGLQGYTGRVDYRVIREVKEALTIPVIASGDALSPQLIRKMFDETGCDGVVIARGALGNPWIFRETAFMLKYGTTPRRPDIDELTSTMISHLNLSTDFHGESTGTMLFRKFFSWYIKGLPDMKPLKDKAFFAGTKDQMISVIEDLHTACLCANRKNTDGGNQTYLI